jgi:hypothetical protein
MRNVIIRVANDASCSDLNNLWSRVKIGFIANEKIVARIMTVKKFLSTIAAKIVVEMRII